MIARRALGASGAAVPVLGLGVSGPHATALVPAAQTRRLVRQALDAGAGLFDTAPFYGDGEAERRLGAALQEGRREAAFVCTKGGTVRTHAGLAKDFSPAGLTASLEASLRNLRTDHVDAFLLHGPAAADLGGAALETLAALKQAGKTRLVGVCGRGAEIEAAMACGGIDLVMLPVGGAFADRARRRAAQARGRGIGLVGIEALAGAARDWRLPRRPADVWYLARAVRRALRDGARTGAGAGAGGSAGAALAAALDGAACDAVLTTTARAEHLAANIAVAEGVRGSN